MQSKHGIIYIYTSDYIGETVRSFKTRCKEHQRDIKSVSNCPTNKRDLNKDSALAKHVCLNWQRIDWERSAILAIESDP